MDELVLTVILAAIVSAAALSGLTGSEISAPFALALVAGAAAMHFAFAAMKKAGMKEDNAALSLAVIVFCGYFALLLSFGLLGSALKLSVLPISLCTPAIASIAKGISI